ncbi:MAG: transcriptional regulator, partial [Caulobacter sp. 35-67-4]
RTRVRRSSQPGVAEGGGAAWVWGDEK